MKEKEYACALLKTIIVDDDPDIREGLRRIVEHLGAEVVAEAEDGQSAVECAQASRPELILLDVSMPGMSGFAAARQLRKLMPNVPIVFVSQHSEGIYAEQALEIGVRGYVLKRSVCTDLDPAITAVMSGQTFVSPLVAFTAKEQH